MRSPPVTRLFAVLPAPPPIVAASIGSPVCTSTIASVTFDVSEFAISAPNSTEKGVEPDGSS